MSSIKKKSKIGKASKGISKMLVVQDDPKNGKTRVGKFVVDDIKARIKFGREKYGTYLMTNNGRSALLDLYQELVDAVFYLRQEILERDGK